MYVLMPSTVYACWPRYDLSFSQSNTLAPCIYFHVYKHMWPSMFHKVFKSCNSPWALSLKHGKLHWTSAALKKGRAPPTVCQSVILHFSTLPQASFICLSVFFSSCTLGYSKTYTVANVCDVVASANFM